MPQRYAPVKIGDGTSPASQMVLATGSEAVAGITDVLRQLKPNQRAFLRVRVYYETDADAARAVGLKPKDVQKWKTQKGFGAAYDQLLTQPLLHARAEMVLLAQKAVGRLSDLVDSPDPKVAIAAIDKVMRGRDAQLISNTVKVEDDRKDDLYSAMMAALAARKREPRVRVIEPERQLADGAVDAEWSEIAEGPAEAPGSSEV